MELPVGTFRASSGTHRTRFGPTSIGSISIKAIPVSVPFDPAAAALPSSTINWEMAWSRRTLLAGFWVFLGYYLGAKLGFALTFTPHPVSVLWPPNSILVAALLLTSPRRWWFILVAAFPAHWVAQLQSQVPPTMILSWFVTNCCEGLIGAGLTRYFLAGPMRFTSLRNVSTFCLCVALAGPFLSSFLDAGFVVLNHWGAGG